ncbi:MAG TPA: hypothetical protein DCP91_10375 [Eggerthellaceae bacterium]|nr:hypothetical protein [Eggerthellaceae bacterium]
MERVDYSYTGFYARFNTVDKPHGSLLTGPDYLVGDDFEIFFKTEEGLVTAWAKNKFDAETGYFDVEASRKLQLANARGQSMRAILSFVAYSDEPDPGMYWGEMAIFCYNPAYKDDIDPFIDRCAEKMGEGIRPTIDLGRQAIEKIFTEKNWVPSDTVALPDKKAGMAVLKDHRSLSEKMIEQGRNRNKGCYAVSWLFIIFVIAALIFALHLAGLF